MRTRPPATAAGAFSLRAVVLGTSAGWKSRRRGLAARERRRGRPHRHGDAFGRLTNTQARDLCRYGDTG
ncbi:MAG: hypothetical protein ACRDP6_31590 [Actinoallomurus sp.]